MRYSDKIGRDIRSVREAKGYSQEYLAEMLGLSQSSYANLESGKSNLSVDRLIQVCEILQIDIHKFLASMFINEPKGNMVHEMMDEKSSALSPEVKKLYGELIEELRSEIDFLRSLLKQKT